MSLFLLSIILGKAINAVSFPSETSGIYILIADDTVKGYTSTDNWVPQLYDYQVNGFNVFWMTFLNPFTLEIPPAMVNLAKCKGQAGCPPANSLVIASIGGEAYSKKQWPFLATKASAEAFAQNVSTWGTKYGFDGIDLDIEGTAGAASNGAQNIVYFAQKLRQLAPNFIITQPVYGYPQIDAENDMVNNAYTNSSGKWESNGLIQSVGIMLYSNLNSLQYVKDYADATDEWQGFPITVDVPTCNILPGIQGSASDSVIQQMVTSIQNEQLGGYMVWFASVFDKTNNVPAFNYGHNDASNSKSSEWSTALSNLNKMTFC